MANTTKKKTGHIVLFIVLCLLSVIIAFPFIWMILSSFNICDNNSKRRD